MAETVLGKRSADQASLPAVAGSPPVSVDDVIEFVTSVLGEEPAKPVIERVKEEGIDGEVLCSMDESELKDQLGISKFGLRRKLSKRLSMFSNKENISAFVQRPAPPQSTVTAPAPPVSSVLPATVVPALASAALSVPPAEAIQTRAAEPLSSIQPAAPSALRVGEASQPAETAASPAAPEEESTEALLQTVGTVANPQKGTTEAEQGVEEIENEGPSAEEMAAKEMAEDAEIQKQLDAEGQCIATCKWVISQMRDRLRSREYFNWASKEVRESRLAELDALNKSTKSPGMTVVVVGNTGAGKSTMLNSLLGERNVLPTNGMRACTAALVELTYQSPKDGGATYMGEVDFVSEQEWESELDDLFADLTQQDGRAILHVSDPDRPNYASWCKVSAVYGESYTKSTRKEGDQYKALPVPDLKRKLKMERAITRFLGTTQTVEANDATTFKKKIERFVDSSNEVNGKAFWPIVKMVRMKSSKWDVLKTGGKLVDAPGVRDDNSARDGVVQQYFKEADSIWIVSHIGRAVNDKTAKDMLGESFRRQILMDGQYGSMIFVATQSDNIIRSEIAQNLGLNEEVTTQECARQRNGYTKSRIQEDFIDGLEEMQRMSGVTTIREELKKQYQLPVFTVSGIDYQKLAGVRDGDGEARVWRNTEDTEIPALRRFVHNAALSRRRIGMRKQAEAVVHFCDGIAAVISDDGTKDGQLRMQVRQIFDTVVRNSFSQRMSIDMVEFSKALNVYFSSDIGSQLSSGASTGNAEVMSTVMAWGQTPKAGGIHNATYKATCRRGGAFRRNFNEEMAEPVYRSVSTYWEKTFTTSMQETFNSIKEKEATLIPQVLSKFKAALTEAKIDSVTSRYDSIARTVENKCVASVHNAVDQAKDVGRAMQREVSRSITPAIQEQMMTAYGRAAAEAGPGSHARRKAIIESHVDAHRGAMFNLAIQPVVEGLHNLKANLVKTITKGLQIASKEMEVGFSVFWTVSGQDALRARRLLAPSVNMLKMEATTGLRKLMASQGETFVEPDVDDEDLKVVEEGSKQSFIMVSLLGADGEELPMEEQIVVKTERC